MAAVQNMFADVLLSMLHLLVWRLAVYRHYCLTHTVT